MIVPWRVFQVTAESSLVDKQFTQRTSKGEYQEFTNGNLRRAVAIYRELAEMSGDPAQSDYARLLLARALKKLGRENQSLDEYFRVSASAPSLMDEYGIPLASYACEQLLNAGIGTEEDLRFVSKALENDSWLAPEALYRMLNLVEGVRALAPEKDLVETTAPLLQMLRARIFRPQQGTYCVRALPDTIKE